MYAIPLQAIHKKYVNTPIRASGSGVPQGGTMVINDLLR
jgi:hypothetical protein